MLGKHNEFVSDFLIYLKLKFKAFEPVVQVVHSNVGCMNTVRCFAQESFFLTRRNCILSVARDTYHATPSLKQDLGFCGLNHQRNRSLHLSLTTQQWFWTRISTKSSLLWLNIKILLQRIANGWFIFNELWKLMFICKTCIFTP